MTRADLESLRQPSARMRIAKLRDQHHIMARLFVSGLSNAEVAAETGYAINRVSTLRNSPAMMELVERYRADDHDEWRKSRDATYEYMHRIRVKGLRIIEDALKTKKLNPSSPSRSSTQWPTAPNTIASPPKKTSTSTSQPASKLPSPGQSA